jgi:hypothetical protein
MTNGVVFFSRCRPQGSDTVDLVLRERRVFIGYPAWRKSVAPRRGHLREAVIDFQCSDEDWAPLYASFGIERREYQKNRNFIRSVKPGAIALVPRPNRGVVYAGRVVVPFEVLDDPPWGDDYLRLRHAQGLDVEDEFSHLADVAQCCEVDWFRAISLPLIPAWIRRSLFGRSTYGLVTSIAALDLDGFVILDQLLDNPRLAERAWTDDVTEVERRLVDAIGPNAFEHLCVALLQLEYPEHVWAHVGGSGDGGVDGIGSDANGRVVGLLQCKWTYYGEDVAISAPDTQGSVRQVLAALIHPVNVRPLKGIEFWSRSAVASRVVQHADRLPLAMSLRIKHSMANSLEVPCPVLDQDLAK